jgi:hypothetical protein
MDWAFKTTNLLQVNPQPSKPYVLAATLIGLLTNLIEPSNGERWDITPHQTS